MFDYIPPPDAYIELPPIEAELFNEFIEIVDYVPSTIEDVDYRDGLSDEQAIAFDKIVDWIENESMQLEFKRKTYGINRDRLYKLTGYAGTGKSFLVGRIILQIKPLKLRILCVAPSHKAKRNLAKLLDSHGITDIEVQTLARFLGKAPILNTESGKEEFKRSGSPHKINTETPSYDLVIIDEYSMICESDVNEICNGEHKGLILFLGDPAQLPPIGEKESEVCKFTILESSLTKIIRYSGDLVRVAESYRNNINLPIMSDDGTIELVRNKNAFMGVFIDRLKEAFDFKNFDNCKLITYTNKAADYWNNWIREEYWQNSNTFNIGDRLLAKKPILRESSLYLSNKNCPYKDKYQIVSENSMEFTVNGDFSEEVITIAETEFEYYLVPAKPDEGLELNLRILKPEYTQLLSEKINQVKAKKQWSQYKDLTCYFDSVGFAYAITCHKSQGSTYNYAFIDLPDLYKCSDKNKIIYTALTRAKTTVYTFKV